MLTLVITTLCERMFLMSTFNLGLNENYLSEPVENHKSTNLKMFYTRRHITDTLNAIRNCWNICSSWPLEVGMPTLTVRPLLDFWTKSYHVTSVLNTVANPLIYGMSLLHDMSSWYLKSNGSNTSVDFVLHRASYLRKHYSLPHEYHGHGITLVKLTQPITKQTQKLLHGRCTCQNHIF